MSSPLTDSDEPSSADSLPAQMETEIAQLAGGLAHEIRNPLSTIRMNLDLLAEEIEESQLPQLRRMTTKVDRIRRECLHLEEILTAFLQFARAGELQLERTDLGDLVTDFIEVYAPQAEQQQIVLSPHLAADMPAVLMDPRLMRQVIMNLVLNAQQAMPQGGQIVFQTFLRAGRVCLEIIDTGKGIPTAAREKLFQVFFSTKPAGSGLGLPTVRKIVEAHGGTVTCDSEVGKGTRFVIALPVATADSTARSPC
ncbi:MAG: sensor histidine kinase [Planctomycetaceae bacterium]